MKEICVLWCLAVVLLDQTFKKTQASKQINSNETKYHKCPNEPRCDCLKINKHQKLMNVNCSKRHLSDIPMMNITILKFDLSFNKIKLIPENIFKNGRGMTELDLSNNVIEVIYTKSFFGATSLLTLNLSRNHLLYKSIVFHTDCFMSLSNLKILNIENNVGNLTSGQIYPNMSNLKNLEHLTMDGVRDPEFAIKLETLANLQYLKMSNFSGICKIKELNVHFFKNTPNLRVIDLSKCEISKIQRGVFKNLTKLSYLDLSHNTNLHFEGVEDLVKDLPFTSIKILKLNKIYETFHLNIEVPYAFSKSLSNTSLKELHVDNNRIQLVHIGVLANLPKTLSFLSAAENEMSFGLYLYELLLTNINELNVSNLFPTRDISSGRINKRQTSDQAIELYRKANYGFGINNFKINVHVPVPKYLKKVYINRSLIRFSIPQITFLENSLEHIDASENLATQWIGPVNNAKSLKYLDMSGNFCSNVSDVFFSMLRSLETLLLSNNLLGFVIPHDYNGNILSAIGKLKVLYLSQNRITAVPTAFFQSLVALERLDLSYNLLEDVEFSLNHMKNLSFVNLANNHITSLGKTALNDIEAIQEHNTLTLDLSNNPLQCNCETIEFVKWLATTRAIFQNRNEFTCIGSDTSKIYLQNPRLIYQKLTKDCSQQGGVIAIVAIGLVIFIAIVVFGIVYRYRWKLRYIYYMTKQKYQGYELFKDSATDYLYDAFVSYADEDQEFIHGELTDNLERDGDFKLCLHKRDFVPGHDVAGNITNAIHKSRKTIVVLTEHFLKSYWCMFEFNMARMESLYTREGKNVLFVILLKHVATKDMPLIMCEILQSKSYIEYPNDEFGNNVFWLTLKKVLQ